MAKKKAKVSVGVASSVVYLLFGIVALFYKVQGYVYASGVCALPCGAAESNPGRALAR